MLGNTHRGNGVDRFALASPDALVLWTVTQATTRPPPLVVADRQTRQGEPSGSEQVNIGPLNSGVPTPLAIERHFAPAKQCRPFGILPSEGFSATLPRVLVRSAQAAFGNTKPWERRDSLRFAKPDWVPLAGARAAIQPPPRQSEVSFRNSLVAIKSTIP